MTDDGKSLVEGIISYASAFVGKRFHDVGKIGRMYHFVCGDGRELAMPSPLRFSNSYEKDLEAAMVRCIFERLDVIAYVLIDEAWMLHSKNAVDSAELQQLYASGGSLQDRPDRQECVMLIGESPDGLWTARRMINRPARGKARLGELEWTIKPGDGHLQSEGRLIGMLPRRGSVM